MLVLPGLSLYYLSHCFCYWTRVSFFPYLLHDIFWWNIHSESFLYLHKTMHCCRTADHRPGFEFGQMPLLDYTLRHRTAAIFSQWFIDWSAFDIIEEIVSQFYTPYKCIYCGSLLYFPAVRLGHIPCNSLIQASLALQLFAPAKHQPFHQAVWGLFTLVEISTWSDSLCPGKLVTEAAYVQ